MQSKPHVMTTGNRREFLKTSAAVAASLAGAPAFAQGPKDASDSRFKAINLFCCDFNWARWPDGHARASQPEDWADVDAQEYFDWHREFGNNVTFCQAYCHAGYALYPSKLGPVGKGKAGRLAPDLFALAKRAGMPTWSYFCAFYDELMAPKHPEWLLPGSVHFGPETPYHEITCERVREFFGLHPVDWLLFDWFVYSLWEGADAYQIRPAEFVKKPFKDIIGRTMPSITSEITPQEHLEYTRAVLARAFYALREAVKQTSPQTKIIFNVPYVMPDAPQWREHPMLSESDGLFAESSDDAIVNWLLKVRKPHQRVMTTIIGRLEGTKVCDPDSWRKWYDRGCDLFGYAWGTPPDFRPVPAFYEEGLKVVRTAFKEIP